MATANSRPSSSSTPSDKLEKNTEGKLDAAATTKPKRPPPFHIRTKEGWPELAQQLKSSGVVIKDAKNFRESIQVQVETAVAFRSATKRLDAINVPYHTYALPEEKLVRAVIKGVPEGTPCEEIKQELARINLPVVNVTRFKSLRNKSPLPMVLVQLTKAGNGAKIFELSRLMHLVIKVEPQHRKQQVGQCFRCHRFGHSARNCHADARCVKCAKFHFTYNCTKDRSIST